MRINRRKAIQSSVLGSAPLWAAPVVQSVVLPAHAITSSPCESAQLRVYDDGEGSNSDDSFRIFIDDEEVGRTLAPSSSEGICFSGIESGLHSIRIEFIEDVDDPDGNDNEEGGSYAVELFDGLQFGDTEPTQLDCTACDFGPNTDTSVRGELFPQGASHEYDFKVP